MTITPTYRINTPVGPMARWLPSLTAAKERYTADTMEAWRTDRDGDAAPVITFEVSTEGEDGEVLPEYTRCLRDGRWDCSICVEPPAWPSFVLGHGTSPDLVMVTDGVCSCRAPRLICSGPEHPRIHCEGCGCVWRPAQGAAATEAG